MASLIFYTPAISVTLNSQKLGGQTRCHDYPGSLCKQGTGQTRVPEQLRLESIAALEDVDYVALNDSSDAVSVIKTIQPTIYVKGSEYRVHDSDVTGKIVDEVDAVQSVGGKIEYTDDIIFQFILSVKSLLQ